MLLHHLAVAAQLGDVVDVEISIRTGQHQSENVQSYNASLRRSDLVCRLKEAMVTMLMANFVTMQVVLQMSMVLCEVVFPVCGNQRGNVILSNFVQV